MEKYRLDVITFNISIWCVLFIFSSMSLLHSFHCIIIFILIHFTYKLKIGIVSHLFAY